ncbi:MAG: hypothetical protein LH649_05585 [Pseudanabaena sp. CAN_BIN31]|nr:hypothetical protein [Pseudanabaena sp. CAN_BIN31]
MSFREQNLAKLSSWKFIEMWIDPTHDLPYILMLVGDVDGNYSLYDPTEGYKVVYSARDYEAVKDFLLEDEYEQIRGRYQDLDSDISTQSLVIENKSQNLEPSQSQLTLSTKELLMGAYSETESIAK